jgi:peptide/nickel transport system ATP-binding protein/oligopeptide transport system ATP-binding protein
MEPDLRVENLLTKYPIRAGFLRRTIGHVHALNGVSFDLLPNETLGIVGESGCGKTTLGRSILRLTEPNSGSVLLHGENVRDANSRDLRKIRKQMQIVFQDPYASLNPRMPVNEIVGEPLAVHGVRRSERREQVANILSEVGLLPEHGNRYPHEFSGGQRQRIGIARALILNPSVLILDEPVSALDVSIQAQILNLLKKLQRQKKISMMFIAHDLSVVQHVSDRVAVMYLGRIMEIGDRVQIYGQPKHPYTASLLSAAPIADPKSERTRKRIILQGDVPSPANPPSGCEFRTRCPIAQVRCAEERPPLRKIDGVSVACHFPLRDGESLLARASSSS